MEVVLPGSGGGIGYGVESARGSRVELGVGIGGRYRIGERSHVRDCAWTKMAPLCGSCNGSTDIFKAQTCSAHIAYMLIQRLTTPSYSVY